MIDKTMYASKVQVHVVSSVDFLKIFSVTGTGGILSSSTLRRRNWKRRFHSKNVLNVFVPHCARVIWKRHNHQSVLGLCLRGSRIFIVCHRFRKLCFQNVFPPNENERPAFSNSSGLKSSFEKLCFGLVWTEP